MQGAGGVPDTGPGIDGWARDALSRTSSLSGARRVGLALTEGGGRRLRFTASDRDSGAGLEWCHVDAYEDVPLNTAVRTGQQVLGSLDDLRTRYRAFVERQRGTVTVAVAAVPMVAAGQTLGGYVLFFDHLPAFDARQRLELAGLGEDLGRALRRAQLAGERATVALADEPVSPGAVVAVQQIPPQLPAVGQARRFLRRTLQEWGVDEETADTAVLCLSELVTNAVIHAHTGCVIRVLLERGVLTTSVRDSGTADPASRERREDPLRVHGRGLQVVDALATRWGSDLANVGTTVWFVLEPQ